MKSFFILVGVILMSMHLEAQQSAITLGGGYSFGTMYESDALAEGWRMNGLYEYYPGTSPIVHGFSFGYINTSARDIEHDYTIVTFPTCYSPKYLFGNGAFKGFIKAAIGLHLSTRKNTFGGYEIKANATGFYGGLGAGVMKTFNEKIFLNLEYEWSYLTNSYYEGFSDFYADGVINSVMLGIGMKL